MQLTPYIPLVSLGKSFGSYLGGFCKFWYTPIQNLNGFPAINPARQFLKVEPALKTGCTWYGPVDVPNNDLGFDQQTARSGAGTFFKRKIQGLIPGIDALTYTNTHNMLPHQLCVVGQLRSSNIFLVVGNNLAGLDLDIVDTIGVGIAQLPSTKLTFTDESITGAMLLASFSGSNSIAPINPSNPSSGFPYYIPHKFP